MIIIIIPDNLPKKKGNLYIRINKDNQDSEKNKFLKASIWKCDVTEAHTIHATVVT